jgi:hypothetical protein
VAVLGVAWHAREQLLRVRRLRLPDDPLGGPSSTTHPACSTTMRSVEKRALAGSRVTKSIAMPSSRRSDWTRFRTASASDTSMALTGSSQRSSGVGTTIALATATRWR